jgi:hypothetical protein
MAVQATHRLAERYLDRTLARERGREPREWGARAAAYAAAWSPTPLSESSDGGNPLRAFFNAEMWHDYFGPRRHVYGVDLEEACLRYASDSIRIFIGDQADREFWRRFRSNVPKLDIVVDDGGHKPDQQTTSLEELLPHLSPGGV